MNHNEYEQVEQHNQILSRSDKTASLPQLKFRQEKKEIEPARTLLSGGMSEPRYEFYVLPDTSNTTQEEYYNTISMATGTINEMLGTTLLNQAQEASPYGSQVQFVAEAVSASLIEIKPRDPIEGMLVAQLVALHNQMMHYMKMATKSIIDGHIDLNINRFTRLNRCFLGTLDALTHQRKQGAHTIRVEHVNVNEGGKAMIGTFNANTTTFPKI